MDMTNQSSLVSGPRYILNILFIHNYIFTYVLNLLNPGCTEIQEVLQLIQAEKSGMQNPAAKDKDVLSCEDLDSPTKTDNITLLLQQNIDKLVENLK